MKVSYLWLKEFVDFDATPQELAEDLSMLGVVAGKVEAAGNDYVLDLDVTTNRPDCLSHFGVAREVAARYQQPLRSPDFSATESARQARTEISVTIASPELCSRYCARVMKGVKVAPSPLWLAQRLESLGIRDINNVVDATNYVLLELGHPLHAFDLSRIQGRQIIVRQARPKEVLVTLDGESRELAADMLVIADRDRAVALAGIMGGAESEIGFSSSDVLLESAWFEPTGIRGTSKAMGLHTEASHRFERGADVIAARLAIDRAAALIQQLAGGELLAGVVDAYPPRAERPAIPLRRSRIGHVMGTPIENAFVERILVALNFQILSRSDEGWQVQSPASRLDVDREIDLIEEIARHYGYGRFASTLPAWTGNALPRPDLVKERTLKQRLLGLGYSETITYSFIAAAENEKFGDAEPVRLRNPLSLETEVMRTSMVPGLLASCRYNYFRARRSVRIYEIGRLYPADEAHPLREKPFLGILASGNAQEKTVHSGYRPFNFFDLKGDIETLLESLKMPAGELRWLTRQDGAVIPDYYHPTVSAEFFLGNDSLGVVGQLHPSVSESNKIRQPVFLAEIPLAFWYDFVPAPFQIKEPPKFPAVQRDLSLIVDEDLPYVCVTSAILQVAASEEMPVQSCAAFDTYAGGVVPSGKKGLGVSIFYQASDRTLVEEDVNRYHETVLNRLREELGAQLRT